jgi:predicted MFS family arabinose efflux permease
MAIIGGSIALSFALSVIIAAPLYEFLGMSGIFIMMAILGLMALVSTLRMPTPSKNLETTLGQQTNHWQSLKRFLKILNYSN